MPSNGTPNPTIEATHPAIKRRFQFTDLVGNNNKWWMVEAWDQGRIYHTKVTYARVGSECARPYYYNWSESEIMSKIASKIKEGYEEVRLHTVKPIAAPDAAKLPVVPSNLHSKVQEIVGLIFSEAGEAIKQFLSVSLDDLSDEQIQRGFKLLGEIRTMQYQIDRGGVVGANKWSLINKIQAYYTTIPTQLPRKIKPEEVAAKFDSGEQETRLQQLRAALATKQVIDPNLGAAQPTQYDMLGAEIAWLDPHHPDYKAILQLVSSQHQEALSKHGKKIRIRDIFAVSIPGERKNYEANRQGKSNVMKLFHGTINPNVRHILKSGLIVPMASSGIRITGRMFGDGIYFAPLYSKAANYCGRQGSSWTGGGRSLVTTGNIPNMLLVCNVAVGNAYVPSGSSSNLKPPQGYDSVWAKPGRSGILNDEIIVYNTNQQSLYWLVTFDFDGSRY